MSNQTAETLLTGLAIGESARWHDGRLWLANWGTGEVLAVDPATARREVVARVPETTVPFSIDWLPDGRLLVIDGPSCVLLRQEPDGELVTHAVLSGLSDAVEGWNELAVDARGNAYVNGGGADMWEGGSSGVIAVVAPDGSARMVAEGLTFPNGMVVTPDGTLIVAESFANRLTAFTIGADGGLSDRRVWAEVGDGAPDGLALDAEGGVWYADVPNARCVRVREGGEVLDTVTADRGCFACAIGGPDGRTLFALAAEWGGPEGLDWSARTGVILTARAPAPALQIDR